MGLFKPAYKSANAEKAVQAVKKIHDQEKLRSIIFDNEVPAAARATAVESLSDEEEKLRVLCNTSLPSQIRNAAIPGLSQKGLLTYASLDLVGINKGGELDMVISRIEDKKAVAQTIWAQKRRCFNLKQLGYTEEDVIQTAQSYPAGSVQYEDCTSYAYRVKSPQLTYRLAQIMATHPINASNSFFDEGLVQCVQSPGGNPKPIGVSAEALAEDREFRSLIARDWLLTRKDDHELMAKMASSIGTKAAVFYVTSDKDWMAIIDEIPELFVKACNTVQDETIGANKQGLIEKAYLFGNMNAYYALFNRLQKLEDADSQQLVPKMLELIDYDHPEHVDLQFILDLDTQRCTECVLLLFRSDPAAETCLKEMIARLELGGSIPVEIKALEKADNPTVQKHTNKLKQMLKEEYEKQVAQYDLSDHIGVSAQQNREIREGIRARFHVDEL